MVKISKDIFSSILSFSIIFLTIFVVHRFIPSMIWAGIIVIATYPLYQKWSAWFGEWKNASAFVFSVLISLFILIPLSISITVVVKELQIFINYLQDLNKKGGVAPDFFAQIPFVSDYVIELWDSNIKDPGSVKAALATLQAKISVITYYIKQIGSNVIHRGIIAGFTLLVLFFFYRDGQELDYQIHKFGETCLGQRWHHFAHRLPRALRATVNGTIVVGMGVGILMWPCYLLVSFPAPTLTAVVTALAAMIPFVVPVVFLIVCSVLIAKAAILSALIIAVWGTLVMFVADHFVKPVLIGGAIKLPFLAVLFGILGGLESFGVLGLFVGPMIMVLFVTLWRETIEHNEV